jgi:hypothetical protein
MIVINRHRATIFVSMFLCVFAHGCGKPPMRSAQGTVKLDGKPIGNCKVGFFPDTEKFDPNRHGFGFGITDDQGKFVIQHPQGDEGIWAGKYKVTFVAWVDKNGKSLSVDTKPSEVEGGVANRFPEMYEEPSTTPEAVSVANNSGVNSFDFDIKSK